MQIAEGYFSAAEVAVLRQTSPSERIEAFYSCWTRKEAYLKARGQGLMIALSSFTVLSTSGPESCIPKTAMLICGISMTFRHRAAT